jgi:hypothetical protein
MRGIDRLLLQSVLSFQQDGRWENQTMAGTPVSSGNIVLSLIEAVSTKDAVGLGEIDAFIFCNYVNDGWELDDLQSWGPGDYYVQKTNRLVFPVAKYTRFTNVQQLLRPPGWSWRSVSPSIGAQSEAVAGVDVFRSPVLHCEHLASLHILVQVVDFVRKPQIETPMTAPHEIVFTRARRARRIGVAESLRPQPAMADSSHRDSAHA